MNKNRYVERKALCDYDLCEGLFDKLKLTVQDMIPLRKVFLLVTDKGKKILKRCDMKFEDVQFIDEALNYIYASDKDVIRYCRNKDNEVITTYNGKNYIVLDMIEGREATFTNPVEISWCTKAIEKLHVSSKGIEKYLKDLNIKCKYGSNIINEYINDLKNMEQIKFLVKKYKYKNDFDSLFLNSVESMEKQMNKAIELLMNTNYEKMKRDNRYFYLCHNDLAHHNFIIDNDNVNIIDFDYCNIDLRIKDIYIFINKVIKNLVYEKDAIDNILTAYDKPEDKIDNQEREILNSLLCYPYDFVEIIKLYYYKQKSWEQEVFVSRLKNKIELDDFRVELVKRILK